MEFEGTVRNGVIVIDNSGALPKGRGSRSGSRRSAYAGTDVGRTFAQARGNGFWHAGGLRRAARSLHPRNAEAMRTVFADTYYFLALLSPSDAGHPKAVAFTESFIDRMLTTEWVMTELADAFAATPQGRAQFVSTLEDLRADSQARIIPCDKVLMEKGVRFYAQRSDKKWSLTDCISFLVMQENCLTEALTADHHFEQAGFVALLK